MDCEGEVQLSVRMRHNQCSAYSVRICGVDESAVVGGATERGIVARAVAAGAVLPTGPVSVREADRNIDLMRRDQADVNAGVAVVQRALH